MSNDIDQQARETLERDLALLKEAQPRAPDYLQARIMANLPERDAVDDFFAWLRASAWRGVTAAALPLVLGFALGMASGESESANPVADSLYFANVWEAYDSDEI